MIWHALSGLLAPFLEQRAISTIEADPHFEIVIWLRESEP